MILLREIAKGRKATLTGIIRRISGEYGIPLSTLKFNSSKLIKLGIIERYGVNGRGGVRLSKIGLKILDILTHEDIEDNIDIDAGEVKRDIEEIKVILKEILTKINGFHAYSSSTSLNLIYSIFKDRLNRGYNPIDTKLVLSKGHAAPALYAVLRFYHILRDEDFIDAFKPGSIIQSHPVKGCPTVYVSTGSLGQGLSIANGMALTHKINGDQEEVYVVMGDGELDEGQVWEALATASTYCLDNIYLLIDRNGYQLTGETESIKVKESIVERLESFGWIVERIPSDDPVKIINALNRLRNVNGWPKSIIVDTWVRDQL